MALPITRTSNWMRDFEHPFRLFEQTFDGYQLYEEDDEFVLSIDMPGFELDEISVSWDDGVLNVAAEHVDEARGSEKMFTRRFRFPKLVDDEAITATYKHGVLEVSLPVEEGATTTGKQIPIEG